MYKSNHTVYRFFISMFFFCFLFTEAICQNSGSENNVINDIRYVRRNILWFNPSRANEINGIALSAFISISLFKSDSLKIKGINIGILGSPLFANKTNGMSITIISNSGIIHNGLAFSLMMNMFYKYNGVSIAGLRNHSEKGTGIQIGLFNYCAECKGLQIGLWNKMGNRGLPFINFNI